MWPVTPGGRNPHPQERQSAVCPLVLDWVWLTPPLPPALPLLLLVPLIPVPQNLLFILTFLVFKKKSSKRKKLVTCKGNSITLSEDFSEKVARVAQYTQSDEIWKKKKSNQSQVSYLAKSSFRTEGEKKSFPDKQKLKETITTEPTL